MHENEAQLLNTLETVTKHMAVTRCSQDFQYLWANQAYADWIRRPLNEIVDRPILEVLGKDAFEALLPHFNRVLAGETVRYEQETNFRGIGTRWILATYTPTLDAKGVANGWVAVVLDITERKRAEEARFRHTAIVESSEDAIISKNLDAVITSWNAGAERIFGYTEAEVIGQPITILIPPELRDEENQILEKLRAGKRLEHYETIRVTKTGKKVDVSLSISPINDSTGKMIGFCKIAHDITRRKEAEEALRTSEERLRLAQQAAQIGAFEWNIRTGVNTWTPELEGMYGLPPGGFGGTQTAFENLVHPDDRARVIELVDDAMKTEQPSKGEWRVVWPDGSVHWIAGHWQVFINESGHPSRMIGVNIDVTDQKRAEETLSGMTRKLVEAQEQERTRIARELHDDINQRLALLALELNQLRAKYKDLPSGVLDHMLELQQMTADICSGVYALSHELHFSTLDLLGLSKGISSWCKAFGERHKIEIDFKNGDLPKLPQEISLCLFRVLQEAVHNVAKHSGVKRVEVELAEKLGEIHLIVSDLGRGFDIKAAKQREGLGLTSMQERVRLVGGKIVINSKPLVGTTIHVCVPSKAEHRFQKAAD